MTDRAFEPPAGDPFASIFSGGGSAPARTVPDEDADNPFAKIMPRPAPASSAVGAFSRGALRNVIPGLGSLPAIGAGAEVGAAVGALGGPFAPVTVPVGGFIGGVAGGYFGAEALSTAQDYALSKAPDSWKEAIGLDDRQEKLDQAAHPYASFLGGLAPYAVTMRPGGFAKGATRESATALERIMAHPLTARLFGGAAMGGIELGQEEIHGETPDWAKVAVSTGFGLIFNKPTRFGEAITEFGARPARRVLGRAEPTTADAADLGVMGPGRTEETFRGSHETDPAAVASAAETKRTEQSILGPDPAPDVHTVARRIAPDLFAHYDELQARRDALRAEPAAEQHLAATNAELAEIQPQVEAVYRRAAEHAGSPVVEPPAVPLRTGLPHVDAILADPEVADAIANPKVNRKQDVPYTAGPDNEGPGLNIDRHFPEQVTVEGVNGQLVMIDTAEAMAHHEFPERAAIKKLMAGGMAQGPAYSFAHWEVAEPTEAAYYRSKGVDPAKVEAAYQPYIDKIEHEKLAKGDGDVPANLFKKPYPHDNVNAAAKESAPVPKPTAEEIAQARRILGGDVSRETATPPSTFIRDDIARQLTRAGRPPEEAQAAGALIAARYQARASAFRGALGSAEDLYRAEAPEILGPGMRSAQPKGATQPRGPRKVDEEKLTLLQFLAHRGGLERTADLESILDKNPFVPGFGRMFRQGGMSMDRAREAAVEAGYIQEEGIQRGGGKTTVRDLLDAIADEARGRRRYRPGQEPEAAGAEGPEPPPDWKPGTLAPEKPSELMTAEDAAEFYQRRNQPEASGRIAGISFEGTQAQFDQLQEARRKGAGREEIQRLIDGFRGTAKPATMPVEDRIRQAYLDIGGKWNARVTLADLRERLPDIDRATFDAAVKKMSNDPGSNAVIYRNDNQSQIGERERQGALMVGNEPRHLLYISGPSKPEREFFQRRRAAGPDLFAEREAEGQANLPGTERISEAERLQRLADAKLRPTVLQKPMDEGLFGDADKQGEMFQAARGKVTFAAGRRPVLTLMREADASTFVHETGHIFLEELMHDAAHDAAPDQIKTDAATALKWLGAKSADDISTRHHEKFARGFEQYMREGVAPSKELASVFARFKDWLLSIYKTIKGLGAPINDDIRRVFDRMLSAEPQRTVIAPEREPRKSLGEIHAADAEEFSGQEAEAAGARVDSERDRAHAELPPDIADEHAKGDERAEAANPSGKKGPGGGGSGAVQPPGDRPANEPPGGGSGERSGAERGGVGEAPRQGAGVSEGTGGQAAPGREESRALPLAPGPAASFERLNLNVGKDGNVRVENLTSVPELVQAIEDSAKRTGGGGPLTMGEMTDLAEAVGLEAKDINEAQLARLFGGVQNLSAKVWALRQAVVASSEIVHAAMQKVRDTGSDAAVAEFAKAAARHDMIQSVLSSVTTEIGRGLGMGFRNLEGWQKAQDLNQFLQENTGRTLFQLKQIAKLGAQLSTPAQVSKFLRDASKRSFGGMILEYWINGLISGPATHVTYMMGNAVLALQKTLPETLLASAIGAGREAMGRTGERVRAGESLIGLKTMVQSLPAATQAMLEAIRTGQATLLPGQTGRPLTPFQGQTAITVARSLTNDPVSWREVGADLFGMMQGLRTGLQSGAALIAAGGHAGAPLVGLHYSPLGQIPDVAVRGVPVVPIGSAIRLPGRAVAAVHSFFAASNYSREIAAMAYRDASEQGLAGNAFASHVANVRQNPTQAQMDEAIKGAYASTLMSEGGAFVKALSALTNAKANLPLIGEIRPLKFIDPFVHIGANVIDQAIVQRTPLGILSSEIRADLMGKNGNIAQDMAAARMLAGTALSLVFGGLAMEGYASGSGPSDPRQSAMWRLAGNQAHSVRIGDIWYQTNRLGPIGMLMGVAADMYDVAHDAAKGDMLTAAAHLQHAVTQNILDESFMRGPSDLIKAVEDPGRYGEAYLKQFVSSFVPFSVGMAQIARASDPYSRQARTVMDEIKRKTPGMSETLWPRRDIWGEELPNPEALLAAGVTAIWETRMSRDPVNLAMLDLGIAPAAVERKIRNIELTEQQYDDFARVAGRMTKMRLDTIVNSPDWRVWPNHIRADVITETIRQSREAARGQMMMKYPSIARDAVEFRRKKAVGE